MELAVEAAQGSAYGSSGDGEWPQDVQVLTGCSGRWGHSEVQDGIKSPHEKGSLGYGVGG